jgi:hypothetical protein
VSVLSGVSISAPASAGAGASPAPLANAGSRASECIRAGDAKSQYVAWLYTVQATAYSKLVLDAACCEISRITPTRLLPS